MGLSQYFEQIAAFGMHLFSERSPELAQIRQDKRLLRIKPVELLQGLRLSTCDGVELRDHLDV